MTTKIKNLFTGYLKEKFIFGWARPRKNRIVLFVVLFLCLLMFSFAPYFNLVFNFYLVALVATVLAPFVLDMDPKLFFIVATILLVLALPAQFFDPNTAETLGNYVFIALLSGVLRSFVLSWRRATD